MFLFISTGYVSIDIVIWSICIGANLAVIFGYYSKNYIGAFVRKLLS